MQNLLIKVYNNKGLSKLLHLVSHAVSLLCVAMIAVNFGYFIYLERYVPMAKMAVSLLIGFIFVSGVRDIINAPRPYELYDFYKKKPKGKSAKSFPSRHAYSAFAIALTLFSVHTALGIAFVFLAVTMCVCRVLLGIHFIRDVVCGALLGITAGVAALFFAL